VVSKKNSLIKITETKGRIYYSSFVSVSFFPNFDFNLKLLYHLDSGYWYNDTENRAFYRLFMFIQFS